MSAPAEVDVAVIGAGIVGLAATDALARRGASVVCLDGGGPGHGQSAGAARGFRHLHDDPALMRLARRSRAGWRAWEERAGTELLERGGVVRLGGDVEPDIAALREIGVQARVLDGAEAARRMPWLAPEAGPLLLDPEGGALRARAAIAALARFAGDRLVRARVEALEPSDDGVTVRTTAGAIRCRRCLVCAGAGTERLVAPLGIAIERDRRAHLRLTFATAGGVAADGPAPVWSDRSGRFGEGSYGVPEGPGRYALGLTVPDYPAIDDPFAETVTGGLDLRTQRARLIAYAAAAMPGLDPAPVDAVLRLTTTLRGASSDAFGLWARGGVLAFAGHNLFKHAPSLGELLADAALDDGPPDPLLRPPRPAAA